MSSENHSTNAAEAKEKDKMAAVTKALAKLDRLRQPQPSQQAVPPAEKKEKEKKAAMTLALSKLELPRQFQPSHQDFPPAEEKEKEKKAVMTLALPKLELPRQPPPSHQVVPLQTSSHQAIPPSGRLQAILHPAKLMLSSLFASKYPATSHSPSEAALVQLCNIRMAAAFGGFVATNAAKFAAKLLSKLNTVFDPLGLQARVDALEILLHETETQRDHAVNSLVKRRVAEDLTKLFFMACTCGPDMIPVLNNYKVIALRYETLHNLLEAWRLEKLPAHQAALVFAFLKTYATEKLVQPDLTKCVGDDDTLCAAREIRDTVRDFTVWGNAAAHVEKPSLDVFRAVFGETFFLNRDDAGKAWGHGRLPHPQRQVRVRKMNNFFAQGFMQQVV
jgi:hypothetical protein